MPRTHHRGHGKMPAKIWAIRRNAPKRKANCQQVPRDDLVFLHFLQPVRRQVYRALPLLLFAVLAWASEAPPAPLPPNIARILDAYDAEVVRAQDAYRKAAEAAKTKATKALEGEQAATTRKGDLEGALLVKAKIDALATHNPGGLAAVDILGVKIAEDRQAELVRQITKDLLGRWNTRSAASGIIRVLTFYADGRVIGHTNNLRWKITENQVLMYETDDAPPILVLELPLKKSNWIARYANRYNWTFNKIESP